VSWRERKMNRSFSILVGRTSNELSVNTVYLDGGAMGAGHIGIVEDIALAVDLEFPLRRGNLGLDN